MPPDNTLQRIAKLAPLEDVFHRIDALAAPVKAQDLALNNARGFVLAEDVVLASSSPAKAMALVDGWAVRASDITDAGPYAPVSVSAKWVEAGEPMPQGADAVLPPDAASASGETIEVNAPAAEGEGVWPAGGDGEKGALLGRAGEQLRATDVTAMQALGIGKVSARVPKISLVRAKPKAGADATLSMIARMVETSGGAARTEFKSLGAALKDADADAVIVIGGSGAGRTDESVKTLARLGRVELHGIGLQPGETAALGVVEKRPVLIVPGRLDAALADFSVLGLRLVAKLAGRKRYISQMPVKLARKVASQVGIASFVPLERILKTEAAPLSSGTVSLAALARADGWLLVPAESEGYPAGTEVEMRLFP
jgi:molybdopterin biosynthesis enzyme